MLPKITREEDGRNSTNENTACEVIFHLNNFKRCFTSCCHIVKLVIQ